jgi:Tol biopolymer transport system component
MGPRRSSWLSARLLWTAALSACNQATEPSGGTIAISVVTSGDGSDADGYRVVLDNLASRPVAGTDSLEFVQIEAGTHRVRLLGLAGNCTSPQGDSRTVELAAQARADVAFEVACRATPGTLVLGVETSGDDEDPNGYGVLVDGQMAGSVASNGSIVLPLEAGDHLLALDGATPNCTLPAPQTETQRPGEVARLTLHVTCQAAAPYGRGHEILFMSDRGGASGLHLMNEDGTGVRAVPFAPQLSLSWPSWSPSGDRIAVRGEDKDFDSEIYVLTLGAAQAVPVSSTFSFASTPTWSPDGSTIAFWADGDANETAPGVFLVGSDGSEQRLLREDFNFEIDGLTWSPDGTRMATDLFFQMSGGVCGIGLLAADGSSAQTVLYTICGAGDPAWSPDGRKLAYSDYDDPLNLEIFVRDLADSTTVRLTHSLGFDGSPSWSPDGQRIAFTSTRDGNAEIYVMNADGSNEVRITNDSASDASPEWRP